MNVLVVDVGGTHVKLLATGQSEPRKFVSGPTLTAERMVAGVKELASDWKYDVVAIGYPGPVLHGRPVAEPHNLVPVTGSTIVAFGCPVMVINDVPCKPGELQGRQVVVPGLVRSGFHRLSRYRRRAGATFPWERNL
jgi:polyphosphate glucokinase